MSEKAVAGKVVRIRPVRERPMGFAAGLDTKGD